MAELVLAAHSPPMPMYIPASAKPSKKPNPTFPRGLPGCFLLRPKGSASNFCSFSEAADTLSPSVYFRLKFVCWYASAPTSDKLLMCSLASPSRDTPNIRVLLLLLACLICLSLFATTDAFSEILGGSAYPWTVKPYQNSEIEMEIQEFLHETSASCTCSSQKAALQTHRCPKSTSHACSHSLTTTKTQALLVQG